MIKAIIFDYGGVFNDMEARFLNCMETYAKKYGKDPKILTNTFWENWRKARVNEIPSQKLWDNIAAYLETDPVIIRTELMECMGFRPEMIEIAKKLKKNYKLGLLSNQIEDWLEEIIKKYQLDQIFDVIVTSYKEKIPKPDIEIFKITVERLGVQPETCVYIDDLEKNISPAKELGMKPILFKNIEQMKKELQELLGDNIL